MIKLSENLKFKFVDIGVERIQYNVCFKKTGYTFEIAIDMNV